jgi:biotin transport system substrate-specific component
MVRERKFDDFIYGAIFAALISVLGLISIPLPFGPVPITGQSLGVMLAGCLLTPRQAGIGLLGFLLLGAAGIPVFAGASSGLGILVGPRGGYLVGYAVGAVVIALLKGQDNKIWRLAIANIFGGIIVVYFCGVLWLNFVTGIGLDKALLTGALPFIPGDLIKVVIATFIGAGVSRRLSKVRV